MGNKRNITQFAGENYLVWKNRVRSVLIDEGVITVIDEEVPANPNASWVTKNNKARGIIMNYLADSHISYALNEGAASKEIFKNLDDTYDRRSLLNQWAIERKIHKLKLDLNTTSLLVHFEKFNNLITTLVTARGKQIKEGDKIGMLLQSLPKEYNQVVTSIETMNESQEITYAFAKTDP